MSKDRQPRYEYHPRTRGTFVLKLLPHNPDPHLDFDDNGKVIRRIAGGAEDLPPQNKKIND